MDLDLVADTAASLGEPSYRTAQVWRWAARGAASYEEMSDLPRAFREALAERVPFSTLALEREARSSDGTVKALLRTADGRLLEAVSMRYRQGDARSARQAGAGRQAGGERAGRRSLCLSSQSGCPLTCTFCATGAMRFGRNLTAWEILDQALHFRRSQDVDNAVFMGMGEPMMNLDSVLAACARLPDLGITHRRTAISTVGWIPGIDRLAADPMPIRLALSLHAADDALRSELMPVNERYPLEAVLDACRRFYERKRRMVFIEYVMLAGVNDAHPQAVALAARLDPKIFKVNLIPYNPTGSGGAAGSASGSGAGDGGGNGDPFRGSSPKAIEAFRAELERRGIGATVRLTRGRDIDAACGQLAARG